MKIFKVGDIVRWSYNPAEHHTPGFYRARIIGIEDRDYRLELLEFYGYWSELTLAHAYESIERASTLFELVDDETNKQIEEMKSKWSPLTEEQYLSYIELLFKR